MRYLSLLLVLGVCIHCGGDSSSLMSALSDSGVGGAPASGGAAGQATWASGGAGGFTFYDTGPMGGWYGGSNPSGGQGGGAGGATAVPPWDAAPLLPPDTGMSTEVAQVDLPWGGNARDLGNDGTANPVDGGIDVGAPPIDGPLIRGFDAELAANLCPSAVTCCYRLAKLIDAGLDGGGTAVCEDIARGDAWRCWQYLLTLQAQGRLCTDLPY